MSRIWLSHLILVLFFQSQTSRANDSCVGAKYASGEHKQLGDSAFRVACEKFDAIKDCANYRVSRKDQKYNYTYGDLITLGDFFNSPAEAFNDKTTAQNLDHVFACIDKEGRALYEQKMHPEAHYPDCTWVYVASVKNYLKLASTNDDHFAWNNIKAYTNYHLDALLLAQAAHKSQDVKSLEKALFINGVADHYLSDAFAAGHVRVPRKQIRDWVIKNIRGPLKHYVSDAFAMIVHDHDGKDRSGREVGLAVRNARGDLWVTHSDYTMNQCRPDSDLSISLPTEALSLSIEEILKTFMTGQLPEGVFAALKLAPYAQNQGLLEHYKLNGNKKHDDQILKDLRDSLPLPLKLVLSKKKLKILMQNLSSIQTHFVQDIQKDLSTWPHLKQRLPEEYWQALANTSH